VRKFSELSIPEKEDVLSKLGGFLHEIIMENLASGKITEDEASRHLSKIGVVPNRHVQAEINQPNTDHANQGYIYFVLAVEVGRIKIGYTATPERRIHALHTSSPFQLETIKIIEGTSKEERALHRRFSHLRVHREWFTDSPELREYISSLSGTHDL
jgi:hypothetical protein